MKRVREGKKRKRRPDGDGWSGPPRTQFVEGICDEGGANENAHGGTG